MIVMCGNSAYCWNTVLTLRRYGGTRDTSTPSSTIWPFVGCSNPAIILSKVVLPQPDGPSNEKNSPLRMAKSACSTATNDPNSLRTLSRTITASGSPAAAPVAAAACSSIIQLLFVGLPPGAVPVCRRRLARCSHRAPGVVQLAMLAITCLTRV